MVKENLARCEEKIEAAVKNSGGDPSGVILVAVTKGVDPVFIREAIDAGVRHIGENRLQEALSKFQGLQEYATGKGIRLSWHMIGHLQSNKVREAVKTFDWIHSVDSVSLAAEIDRQALKAGKIQDILLQVNVSKEATKYGLSAEAVPAAIQEMSGFKNTRICGLMTIAPEVNDLEEVRPYFRLLKELLIEINQLTNHRLTILSMGMTNDFEVAVEEGSTMVRIGRGIFGER